MRGWRDLAVCVVTAGVASVTGAQEVFKCVSGVGTSYQSTPCAVGAFETRMPRISAGTDSTPYTPRPSSVRSQGRKSGPWKHTVLTLGISDDEVLNMVGWGRPGRITRQRASGEWREEWVYGADTRSERRLYFANGKLVDFAASFDERVAISTPP